MKRKNKPFQFHKPIMKWFTRYIYGDPVWRATFDVPIDRYERFVIAALLAMAED